MEIVIPPYQKREFEFTEFNSGTAPLRFVVNTVPVWYQQFPDGRFGLDAAISMRLDPTLKNRLFYLYLFSLVPDWAFLGYPAGTWSWVLCNVRFMLRQQVVVQYPVSIHSNPGGPVFRGPTPTNKPSCIPTGGTVNFFAFPFVPLNPFSSIHTTNSPETALTILQPWTVNFPADEVRVDVLDTTMSSGFLRLFAASHAW